MSSFLDSTPQTDFGLQPLDEVMTRLGLSNADLVRVSTRQLTHKTVQKGRKGRRLTLNAKRKILEALNAISVEARFHLEEIFNYPS
ncbi:MAG: hypothetical protein HQL16_02600 [Candidatus Omnitrophica bacterium]|nr:hypothetical protein [Candidatus Omnitrophota bacterium]